MVKYVGNKVENSSIPLIINVVNKDKKYKLRHVIRHSPTGFQWGYEGSGPADTSLSILVDFCQRKKLDIKIAEDNYMDFKRDFISQQEKILKITDREIENWLKNK